MRKFLVFSLCYNGLGDDKCFSFPLNKCFDFLNQAQNAVEQLARSKCEMFTKRNNFNWAYEVDFDGPYAAAVREYLATPTEGDRGYSNLIEYYIVPIKEKSDNECFAAYIDRTLSGSGQTLNFIKAHHTFDNLSEGTECGVYYDIKDYFGKEIDGGQLDFCSYVPIEDALRDIIEFHYDEFPKKEDFIILE